ncbi:hypothetical protein [Thermodesulfobacterium hydrogeniphilum]|uniref:hypothetical protein n=1 Tax=Thermodesulfobacterium hydrogeniphilum TaxID=161156 RepID=UPI000571775A|nr:hypothetical protein [Thermodesulfobacterium hydrogeniphilum]
MAKNFKSEKDLRLFIKKFLKENLKGLPETAKIQIKVLNIKPPQVVLEMPFYSEGNLIRVNEVDFLIQHLVNLGIRVNIIYLDDIEIYQEERSE